MKAQNFVLGLFGIWACLSSAVAEDWHLGQGARPVEPPTPKYCYCMCKAWIPAPVPTVGGYLRYEYGWSSLATRTARGGYSLFYRQNGNDEASCRANAGTSCDGTDNSQRGWPAFSGNLQRCEIYTYLRD